MTPADRPIEFRSVRELSRGIAVRELSPIALTEAFLDRLEKIGPSLNAVATVTRGRALTEARRAEEEIAEGRIRGPLHGIPYGAKDLFATEGGIPTSWGAAAFRGRTFDRDAAVLRRAGEAGAVLAAKLAMVELAGGMGYRQPNASFTGPGLTPWAAGAWSGGSSSGSGSAVAAGLVPWALGTETWGSILSPASHCGVTGLRPSFGRVSRVGAMTLSWTMDKVGPLARTADDCGLILEAISGADPEDASTVDRPFTYDPGEPPRRFRVGVLKGATEGCEPAVAENFERSLRELGAFADVEREIVLPDLPYETVARTILFAESAAAMEELIESGTIAELTAPEDRFLAYARDAVAAKDYIKALRLKGVVSREADRLLARLDALVAPSRAGIAPPVDREFKSSIRGTMRDWMGAIGNVAGLPAVSIPNGFGERGLPTGLQIMGRAYEENRILALARSLQALTDWHLLRPPESPASG